MFGLIVTMKLKSHLFFTPFLNVHFLPTLGPGRLGWVSGVVPRESMHKELWARLEPRA